MPGGSWSTITPLNPARQHRVGASVALAAYWLCTARGWPTAVRQLDQGRGMEEASGCACDRTLAATRAWPSPLHGNPALGTRTQVGVNGDVSLYGNCEIVACFANGGGALFVKGKMVASDIVVRECYTANLHSVASVHPYAELTLRRATITGCVTVGFASALPPSWPCSFTTQPGCAQVSHRRVPPLCRRAMDP